MLKLSLSMAAASFVFLPGVSGAVTVHHPCSHYAELCREDAKQKQSDSHVCDADLEKARAAKTGEENVGRWPESPQRYCWKKDL
jgi:hypothetical protein